MKDLTELKERIRKAAPQLQACKILEPGDYSFTVREARFEYDKRIVPDGPVFPSLANRSRAPFVDKENRRTRPDVGSASDTQNWLNPYSTNK